MNKNKLIRFVKSLAVLPVMGMFSFGIMPQLNPHNAQIVFIQKQYNEVSSLFAFNQVEDKKLKTLQAQADAIDAYFAKRNMPLEGTGMKMAQEAVNNGLDWRLLAAISIMESTGGKFKCKTVPNNSFGWGSCTIGFKSNNEAIETVARNIGGNNPKTKKYYAGKDIRGILNSYNPPSIAPLYFKKVTSIMEALGSADLGANKTIDMTVEKVQV